MAVKKTELYSSLWASCDELRGGMDSSQYKDYILTLLFMKYVSDKYKGQKYADITVFDKAHDPEKDPEKRTGCSFDDFVALKNQRNIGEGMDKIISRLADVNDSLKGVIDIAHFNDEAKIGKGQEMVDKLTKLISIFQRPELNFSKNKAEGDDIIGDAYEYLMRNFASESGKSKGQFYTPAEVSRILAKVIGIDKCKDTNAVICDPACGSGSLLIRAIAEAPFQIAGYGQEKDSSTAGLAKMNAVLHDKASIIIRSGNTFSDPQFLKEDDDSELKRFDYVVANPPFSMKNWTAGVQEFGRFNGYGDRPPAKNGDYAWLLHILKTLKSTGKAAVILPHGVLFRGNAEETIRKSIVDKGWIKGIISLPPNLFYGTGIPACILVIDKEGAENRQGIFMINASRNYVKDGNKNRLREQDIYRIITTFNEQIEDDPKYARFVKWQEIKVKNKYNLNITRYIDASDPEDIQNIDGHLNGGIPQEDIDSLQDYWDAFPELRKALFKKVRAGFYELKIGKEDIRQAIYSDEEFSAYGKQIDKAFSAWKKYARPRLISVDDTLDARYFIDDLASYLIKKYEGFTLVSKYDVYQVLLAYWNEVMNDDVLLIAHEDRGYALARETENIMGEYTSGKKKGQEKVIGWEGRLIPKSLIIDYFFSDERDAIEAAEDVIAQTESELNDLIENCDDESLLSEVVSDDGKIKKKELEEKIAAIRSKITTPAIEALQKMLKRWDSISKKKDYTAYVEKNPLCAEAWTDKGTINKTSIIYAIKILQMSEPVPEAYEDDFADLEKASELMNKASEQTSLIKALSAELDTKCRDQYDKLTDDEIIELLVNRKWCNTIAEGINQLYLDVSHRLANRVVVLSERYEDTLPSLEGIVDSYEMKVKSHLERMGFKW
ncbi:type I restriction-modification system subunit M [Olegusella massiliensis]|uniref:type I restriction-modification system subunit M n=1 Tax=Olegusella massiliensis TaxID=1776381 RepID=UPI000837CCAD|nr:class I SAM-dependent DNA methyltransferase [Olegusella massiliensis]